MLLVGLPFPFIVCPADKLRRLLPRRCEVVGMSA